MLNDKITFRVNNGAKDKFSAGARRLGINEGILLRKLVDAFNNDTLRIAGKPAIQELYTR